MRRKSYEKMECSVAQALDVVGDPWTLLIVRDLLFGHRRFNVLQQRLGIARNTLTARLNTLVDHGVAERHAYQQRPERYEYRLTEKGRALAPVVITLMRWGDEWSELEEPPVRLVDAQSGEAVDPVLVDRTTGTPIEARTVRAVGPGTGIADPNPAN